MSWEEYATHVVGRRMCQALGAEALNQPPPDSGHCETELRRTRAVVDIRPMCRRVPHDVILDVLTVLTLTPRATPLEPHVKTAAALLEA